MGLFFLGFAVGLVVALCVWLIYEDWEKDDDDLSDWDTDGGDPYVAGVGAVAVERDARADVRSALTAQVGGAHYVGCAIQPIEYIHANGIPFAEGCIIKYATRWRNKGGIADLEKIEHFARLLIELEQRRGS